MELEGPEVELKCKIHIHEFHLKVEDINHGLSFRCDSISRLWYFSK